MTKRAHLLLLLAALLVLAVVQCAGCAVALGGGNATVIREGPGPRVGADLNRKGNRDEDKSAPPPARAPQEK